MSMLYSIYLFIYTHIYLYKDFRSCFQGSRAFPGRPGLSGLPAFGSPRTLKIGQSAPRAAQSRSKSPRARLELFRIAQSTPRAAQTAQNCLERAQSCSESPRASLGRAELFKKPVGEFGDTCTVDSGSQCHLTWFLLLRACICTGSH